MIFVKNSMGGREVNMINTLSKIKLSKIGWEGRGSTSIWIMSLDILFVCFLTAPLNVHDFSSLISLDLVDNYPPNRNIKTFSKHNRRLRFVSRILQGMGKNCIHFLVLIRVMPPY